MFYHHSFRRRKKLFDIGKEVPFKSGKRKRFNKARENRQIKKRLRFMYFQLPAD